MSFLRTIFGDRRHEVVPVSPDRRRPIVISKFKEADDRLNLAIDKLKETLSACHGKPK